MLEFRTLGEITLRRSAEQALESVLVQPKLVALLSYLLVAYPRGFHRRDTLLGLLWAEHDERHARGALRQALHGLRRALGAELVITRGDSDVAVDSERVWCDALAFGQALERGERRRAARLYCGPFLRGLHVPDAPDFDAWMESMRDRLAREYAAALESLAGDALERGETLRAVEWWRQLWDLDPYSARVTMGLMEALAQAGERCAALRVADRHSDLLQRVFEADPDQNVEALAERIRHPPDGRRADR